MHMSTLFVISSALSSCAASGLAIDLALITKHLGIIVETRGPGFNILTCIKFVLRLLLAILFFLGNGFRFIMQRLEILTGIS